MRILLCYQNPLTFDFVIFNRNSPRKYRKNSFVSKSGDVIYDSTPNDEVINDIDKVNSKFMTNNKQQPTQSSAILLFKAIKNKE